MQLCKYVKTNIKADYARADCARADGIKVDCIKADTIVVWEIRKREF